MRLLSRARQQEADLNSRPRILILTPVKDVSDCIFGYWKLLLGLTYPHKLISIGMLEGDSRDNTFNLVEDKMPHLREEFRRARLWKKDFGFHIPEGMQRSEDSIQLERRTVLAKSRNHLLFHALDDEDWVLWIDADMFAFPPDLIERLLATGRDIVHPNCVVVPGGKTYDRNAWADQGRLHFDELKGQGEFVPLDSVGGTILMIKADLHRDGLIFPAYPYGLDNPRRRPGQGEIETEGLGLMALDMGAQPWGMPNFEVQHRPR